MDYELFYLNFAQLYSTYYYCLVFMRFLYICSIYYIMLKGYGRVSCTPVVPWIGWFQSWENIRIHIFTIISKMKLGVGVCTRMQILYHIKSDNTKNKVSKIKELSAKFIHFFLGNSIVMIIELYQAPNLEILSKATRSNSK